MDDKDSFKYKEGLKTLTVITLIFLTLGLVCLIPYLTEGVSNVVKIIEGKSVYSILSGNVDVPLVDELRFLGLVLDYMLIIVIVKVIYNLVRSGNKNEEEVYKITNIRYNNYVRPMELKDVNTMVVIGEDEKLGKLGVIRRLHAILHVTKEGELYIPDKVRHLNKDEEFKQKLCLDDELSESEWSNVKREYSKLAEELQLKYEYENTKKSIKEERDK